MIKQMLAFARKDRPEMHTMDLKDFIKEAYKIAEATLPENIKFGLEYSAEDDFQITGDVTQLQQVLLNLVTNARHAVALTEDPRITLKLDRSDPMYRPSSRPDTVNRQSLMRSVRSHIASHS